MPWVIHDQAPTRYMERFIALNNARADHAASRSTESGLQPGESVVTPTATGMHVRKRIF